MKLFSPFALVCSTAVLFSAPTVSACDLCGCFFSAPEPGLLPARGVFGGVSEQFTHFGTTQFEGRSVPNPTGQYLDSSITQVFGGYNFSDRFGVQVNLPVIYRSYERPAGFDIQRGTESGIGDLTLLAHYVVWRTDPSAAIRKSAGPSEEASSGKDIPALEAGSPSPFSATVNLLAGVKLPTGGTRRLREELNEVEVEDAPPSGVHGHDLTLGTGSVDVILGLNAAARSGRWFAQGEVQYTIRTRGDYNYRFANDLSWRLGPGVYLRDTPRLRLGVQFVTSGEYKPRDRFRGEAAEDTRVTTVFVGPRIVARFGPRVAADLGADLPVLRENSAFQTVPDYRIRAGLTVRF